MFTGKDQARLPSGKSQKQDAAALGVLKNFFSPSGTMALKIAGWRRLNWSFLACTSLYDCIPFCASTGSHSNPGKTLPAHGVGLLNVEKCVQKYKGELKISYTDTTFSVAVVLPYA